MAGAIAFVGDGFSMEAAADLSALQFRFMLISAAFKINKATGNTVNIVGVLQNKPISGKIGSVKTQGGSKLEVDGNAGSISAGDTLTSDAVGKGIVTTTDADTIGAIALEASAADGDIISVLLVNFHRAS